MPPSEIWKESRCWGLSHSFLRTSAGIVTCHLEVKVAMDMSFLLLIERIPYKYNECKEYCQAHLY